MSMLIQKQRNQPQQQEQKIQHSKIAARFINEFFNSSHMISFDQLEFNFNDEKKKEKQKNFTETVPESCTCGQRKKITIKIMRWRTELCNKQTFKLTSLEEITNVIPILQSYQSYRYEKVLMPKQKLNYLQHDKKERDKNLELIIEQEIVSERKHKDEKNKLDSIKKLNFLQNKEEIHEREESEKGEKEKKVYIEDEEKNKIFKKYAKVQITGKVEKNKVQEDDKIKEINKIVVEREEKCKYYLSELTDHNHQHVSTTAALPVMLSALSTIQKTTKPEKRTSNICIDKVENQEKQTLVSSSKLLFNCARTGKHCMANFLNGYINCSRFYRQNCLKLTTTKKTTTTTLTKSKPKTIKLNTKTTTTKTNEMKSQTTKTILLTHYITLLIFTLPRICLIVILLLSLLATTVQHVNCQQDQQQQSKQQQQELFITRKPSTKPTINSQTQLLLSSSYSSNKDKQIFNNNNNNLKKAKQPIVNFYHVQKSFANNSHSSDAVLQYQNRYRKFTHIRNFKLMKNNNKNNNNDNNKFNNNNDNYSQNDDKLINYEHSLIVLNNIIYDKQKANNHYNEQKKPNANNRNNNSNITINFINIQKIGDKNLSQKVSIDHVDISNEYDSNIVDDEDDNDDIAEPNRFTNNEDSQKLMRLVMNGLGLQKLPDMEKVNISQQEYVTKYREYLRRVHDRKRRELAELTFPTVQVNHHHSHHHHQLDDWWEEEGGDASLHIVSIVTNRTNKVVILEHGERQKRDSEGSNSFSSNFSGQQQQPQLQRFGRYSEKTKIVLHFPLNANNATQQLQSGDIEEANIRLMLIHSPALANKHNSNKKNARRSGQCGGSGIHHPKPATSPIKQVLNLKVYQLLSKGKRLWLDGRKIDITVAADEIEETHSQWLQFDVTKAVEAWLKERQENFGLEIQCDNCQRVGARILNDLYDSGNEKSENVYDDNVSRADTDRVKSIHMGDTDEKSKQLMPVLNIIGRLNGQQHKFHTRKHVPSSSAASKGGINHTAISGSSKATLRKSHHCYKANQRCCRHTMEVIFKEIKGFEFILQPKVFDAGYCHGRCPPRYNPAHHHAMLQSLIWKQSRRRAPRPCCAPSKLVELEVLHVDEKDSEKLKISTWTDMRVVECACS